MIGVGWHNNLCSTCGNRYLRVKSTHQPRELLSGSYTIKLCNGCSGWSIAPIPIWELGLIKNPQDYDPLDNVGESPE